MNQNRGINKHILLLDSSEFFYEDGIVWERQEDFEPYMRFLKVSKLSLVEL